MGVWGTEASGAQLGRDSRRPLLTCRHMWTFAAQLQGQPAIPSALGLGRVGRSILEIGEVDDLLMTPEMLPAGVAEHYSPPDRPSGASDQEFASLGFRPVLTVGSELADRATTDDRGHEGPRPSHQRDLGISSSSHLHYSLGTLEHRPKQLLRIFGIRVGSVVVAVGAAASAPCSRQARRARRPVSGSVQRLLVEVSYREENCHWSRRLRPGAHPG